MARRRSTSCGAGAAAAAVLCLLAAASCTVTPQRCAFAVAQGRQAPQALRSERTRTAGALQALKVSGGRGEGGQCWWVSKWLAAGAAVGLVTCAWAAAPSPAGAAKTPETAAKISSSFGNNKVTGNNRVANRPFGFLKDDSTVSSSPQIESKLNNKLSDLEKYKVRIIDKQREDTMWSQAPQQPGLIVPEFS
mmetsp:Transcript_69243/g.166043  ORF Transcript_69243/g.166043 Transcript_69243/m.166043 type:complete len:192 (-) Transcript_69243:189-764(-)|eukprot:CAMPEP_0178426272 /NCGR_PEP_ID=MMETSP0689_2-20121128/29151_1 /TAXON_ID=160604 /ORGANISM="Amphidinium massartii, Strain CS-259" /LENGTH=191 /DNA_ID=CAMNT_0020047957 /DNA_START=102 /DNA_END=677 /DNA_ORIENTATION=-